MNTLKVLKCIGSTESSSFNEICQGLGDDCPEHRSEWGQLFRLLETAEKDGLIEIDRASNGRIDSAILTEAGLIRAAGKNV